MYAISRIESKPNIWRWTVLFRRRGIPYYKSFSDKRCGGSRKALKAAIEWRDRQLARIPTISRREFRAMKRSTTRAQVPGVFFTRPRRMPEGVWRARMCLAEGRRITKSFGVRKFGERGAYKRAVAARAEMLLMVADRPLVRHPMAKLFAARQKKRVRPS